MTKEFPKGINIYRIGTVVEFGDPTQKTITGKITAVTIREKYQLYEISYWLFDDLKTIGLYEESFTVKDNNTKKEIGFKK